MNRFVFLAWIGFAVLALGWARAATPMVWVSEDGTQRLICTDGGWLWQGQVQAGQNRYRFAARGEGAACEARHVLEVHFEAIRLYRAGQVIKGQDAIAGHTSEMPAEQILNAVLKLRARQEPPRLHCLRGSLCRYLSETISLENAP